MIKLYGFYTHWISPYVIQVIFTVYSRFGNSGRGTYGKVSAGMNIYVTDKITVTLSGSGTAGRKGGDDYSLNANMRLTTF